MLSPRARDLFRGVMGTSRTNTLLPLGGTAVIDNHVPADLKDLSGWSRDELQAVMDSLRSMELDRPLQFENYR